DYSVLVTNALGGALLSVTVSLIVDPAAPVITTSPASTAVNVGMSVTLAVAGTGNPVPRYQWSKDGTFVVGATNATLPLGNVKLTDAASYTVTLANQFGTATSAPAVLTIATLTISASVAPMVGGASELTVDA